MHHFIYAMKHYYNYLLIAILSFFFSEKSNAGIFNLSELKKVYVNEISGNDKWLEIYNDENEAVDLTGYVLQKIDEDGLPADWPIPSGTTIEPKGFLVWTQNSKCTDGSTFTWGISAKKDVGFKIFDAEENELDFFDVKMDAGLNSDGNERTVGRKTDSASELILFYSGGTKGTTNNNGITKNPVVSNYPQITNIPTIYINTTNSAPITSKETYVPGMLVAISSDGKEEILGDGSGAAIEIRGRGNSTWGMAKKPYRVKFGSKTNFLNLPAKAKSWTLLANYADKSLIRNGVAFKISELIGLEFSPSARFVDVVLNGEYIGSYMVSDQVEVDENRVNVETQKTTDTTLPDISGGYLLEIDGFASSEPVWFTTGKSLPITVKYPKDDEINPEQLAYIVSFTQKFENALFSSNFKDPESGYRALVDTTSLINWYIGCELTGNSDSFWSTYIYKRKNIDKFFFGPLWDYDIAFNNDSRLGDATQKLMREHAHNPKTWIQRFWEDEWFKRAVYRRWTELIEENIIDQLLTYVDETSTLIDASQKKNYEKWGKLSSKVYLEQNLFPTYNGYVNYLKRYLNERSEFLSKSFASNLPADPSVPFVADNFYYIIQNVRSNNVIQVKDLSAEENAMLELWNPQSDNDSQEWTIKLIKDNIYQIVNKKSGLAIAGNGKANNLIQTAPDVTNAAQQWKVTPVSTGNLYGLVNVKSGYSINNSGGGIINGTAVIEWDNNITGSLNQQWYLTPMNPMEIKNIGYGSNIITYVNNSELNIKYLEGKNKVYIYAITGQLIYSSDVFGSEFTYPLKPGCYIVSVKGNCNYNVKITVIQ